jgi:hypothetical protein
MVNGRTNNQLQPRPKRRAGKGRGKGGNQPPRTNYQPQRIQRAAISAPAGLSRTHHFDAFGNSAPQALAFSVGPATHIKGASTETLITVPGHRYVIMFCGSSSTQYIVFDYTVSSSTGAVSYQYMTSTGIIGTPSAIVPDTFMCSRASLRLRNVSRAADCGGVVRAFNMPNYTQVNGKGNAINTSSDYMNLHDLIRNHPRTRSYSGAAMTGTHQWDAIPTSQGEYHKFRDTVSSYYINVISNPGVSLVCIMLEDFSTPQTYEFTLAATYYARYRVTGPLFNMSINPPTAPLALVNQKRDAAENSWGKQLSNAMGHLGTLANVTKAVHGAWTGNAEL